MLSLQKRIIPIILILILLMTGCTTTVAGVTISPEKKGQSEPVSSPNSSSNDSSQSTTFSQFNNANDSLLNFKTAAGNFSNSYNSYLKDLQAAVNKANTDHRITKPIVSDAIIQSQNAFAELRKYGQDYIESKDSDPAKSESVSRLMEDAVTIRGAITSSAAEGYSTWIERDDTKSAIKDWGIQFKNLK
jgi:uncharacterized membrane protein YdfJ with MMPL/SSD domain